MVSNRQPYSHGIEDGDVTVDRPTGGVTAGLDPVMQDAGGLWVAWGDGDADREIVDDEGCVDVPPGEESYTLRRVWLTEDEVSNYYYGFSNQVLWPLCHSFLGHVNCESEFWEAYRTVNDRFAENAVASVDENRADRITIWFHDYHFALAPRAVRRELGPDADIAQFWHIPWPAWDTFRACPRRHDLLRGLLGCSRIGFHTERYADNFLECVATAVDEATVDWQGRRIDYQGRDVTVQAVPMGVPVDDVREAATSPEARAFPQQLRARNDVTEDVRLAVGVDRLDYTKGIPERLRALEQLWEDSPERRGELTYVQVASVSRSRIPAYEAIRDEVTDCVERINERFGTEDWQPVLYTTAHLSQSELYGLYREADLALVSPIRDGMNLVAQEFVAAQGADPGVLVLSRGTGAYDEIGEHALAIDPFDRADFATTIEDALAMPSEERRQRMAGLRRAVAARNLQSWVRRILRPNRPTAPRRQPT